MRSIRIPQQEWIGGSPPLGADGLPVASGRVSWFDLEKGIGEISRDDGGEDVFFSFTAIPGEGYRTIRPDTPVRFEVIDHPTGPTARNVQKEGADGSWNGTP